MRANEPLGPRTTAVIVVSACLVATLASVAQVGLGWRPFLAWGAFSALALAAVAPSLRRRRHPEPRRVMSRSFRLLRHASVYGFIPAGIIGMNLAVGVDRPSTGVVAFLVVSGVIETALIITMRRWYRRLPIAEATESDAKNT